MRRASLPHGSVSAVWPHLWTGARRRMRVCLALPRMRYQGVECGGRAWRGRHASFGCEACGPEGPAHSRGKPWHAGLPYHGAAGAALSHNGDYTQRPVQGAGADNASRFHKTRRQDHRPAPRPERLCDKQGRARPDNRPRNLHRRRLSYDIQGRRAYRVHPHRLHRLLPFRWRPDSPPHAKLRGHHPDMPAYPYEQAPHTPGHGNL